MWYTGHPGNNTQADFRASGAYIFRYISCFDVFLKLSKALLHKILRPMETAPMTMPGDVTSEVYEGDIFWEVRTNFGDFASQVARIYK